MSFEIPGPVEVDLSDSISPIEEIIEEARQGRMYILVDHEDRENEGDLVIPAEFANAEAINFMATHGRGLICLPMTAERIDRLGIPMMAVNNSSRHETPFTVSIEAREGVSTGISAPDRALTVQNPEGELVFVSKALQAVIGLDGPDVQRLPRHVKSVLDAGENWADLQFKSVGKTGTHVRVRVSPIKSGLILAEWALLKT